MHTLLALVQRGVCGLSNPIRNYQEESMKVRTLSVGLMVALMAACHSSGPQTAADTQTFTRSVDATPARVVEATMAVFSERGITVASSDQVRGEVVSVPLDPNGEWGNVPPAERVNCAGAAAADPNTRLILTVRVKNENDRSVIALDAKRDGGVSCVLRGAFLTQLMDAIAAGARPGA
jgi:hypothetical protein